VGRTAREGEREKKDGQERRQRVMGNRSERE